MFELTNKYALPEAVDTTDDLRPGSTRGTRRSGSGRNKHKKLSLYQWFCQRVLENTTDIAEVTVNESGCICKITDWPAYVNLFIQERWKPSRKNKTLASELKKKERNNIAKNALISRKAKEDRSKQTKDKDTKEVTSCQFLMPAEFKEEYQSMFGLDHNYSDDVWLPEDFDESMLFEGLFESGDNNYNVDWQPENYDELLLQRFGGEEDGIVIIDISPEEGPMKGKNKVVITLNKPLPDVHEPGKKFDVYFSNGVTRVKAVGELLQNRCSIKLLAPPSPTKETGVSFTVTVVDRDFGDMFGTLEYRYQLSFMEMLDDVMLLEMEVRVEVTVEDPDFGKRFGTVEYRYNWSLIEWLGDAISHENHVVVERISAKGRPIPFEVFAIFVIGFFIYLIYCYFC